MENKGLAKEIFQEWQKVLKNYKPIPFTPEEKNELEMMRLAEEWAQKAYIVIGGPLPFRQCHPYFG